VSKIIKIKIDLDLTKLLRKIKWRSFFDSHGTSSTSIEATLTQGKFKETNEGVMTDSFTRGGCMQWICGHPCIQCTDDLGELAQ